MGEPVMQGSVKYASPSDHRECQRWHREYGTTYYFATQLFPRRYRERVHALYAFVRVPDEWVDNPGERTPTQVRELLRDYRTELRLATTGVRPETPVLRAFADVVRETGMPLSEPLCFLDAMEQDLTVTRYATFDALLGYTRGSAAAVGLMMCHALDVRPCDETARAAMALGDAMQLTNFLRDVGEDARRGRIYLPQADLAEFGVSERDILEGRMTPEFVRLMEFQIGRARELYARSDLGIPALPSFARPAVRCARLLYAQILDKIEQRGYDVFSGRARTSRSEKLATAARVLARAW
ncbi:MAG: phytoene/squalene synthase family protein [Fimbriimonadaceae bacterium]|nr:phytoene/squalene synthase family protein [Fimbriimonadaceae bacterium]